MKEMEDTCDVYGEYQKDREIMSTFYDGTTIGSPVLEREVMLGVLPC